MPAERYFIDADLALHGHITMEGTEFHHLMNVMRTKPGEEVELVNGRGAFAVAKFLQANKKNGEFEVLSCKQTPAQPHEVILAQAIPRINRLDTILEKGTELGMTRILLFPGERSERRELSENQMERSRAILIAAMKQCGRLWLPMLEIRPPLAKWTSLPCRSYFGDVSPDAPRLIEAQAKADGGRLIFIGPESGFTPAEEAKLRSLGAAGVKLHDNILRTDTASIAALAVMTH